VSLLLYDLKNPAELDNLIIQGALSRESKETYNKNDIEINTNVARKNKSSPLQTSNPMFHRKKNGTIH
jgi:hypothetical protein